MLLLLFLNIIWRMPLFYRTNGNSESASRKAGATHELSKLTSSELKRSSTPGTIFYGGDQSTVNETTRTKFAFCVLSTGFRFHVLIFEDCKGWNIRRAVLCY